MEEACVRRGDKRECGGGGVEEGDGKYTTSDLIGVGVSR